MNIINTKKSEPPIVEKTFRALILDSGVVLCDSENGAFLCLKTGEEVQRLKDLLANITIEPPIVGVES